MCTLVCWTIWITPDCFTKVEQSCADEASTTTSDRTNRSTSRTTSSDSKTTIGKYGKSTNHGAVMAKRNREKKKQYLQNLERENEALKSQVADLLREKQNEAANTKALMEQIAQLKQTIKQAEPIAKVLASLSSFASVTFGGVDTSAQNDTASNSRTTIPIQLNLKL
jgi:seryl-tRNA synthetase